MTETIQERMARQRKLREAQDGTPDEQYARKRRLQGLQAVRNVERSMNKMRRLAGQLCSELERESGVPMPSSVRKFINGE